MPVLFIKRVWIWVLTQTHAVCRGHECMNCNLGQCSNVAVQACIRLAAACSGKTKLQGSAATVWAFNMACLNPVFAVRGVLGVCFHRDIPARYLLRLGMGERDLDVDDDFSRAGRVNNMLARRLTLLAEVEKLSALLGVVGTEYTCETAGYFWLLHVLSRCVLRAACTYHKLQQ